IRSSYPPRASVTALSLDTRSSSGISLFCKNTWPWRLTDNVKGSPFWSRLLARVCGRSIGTPTVSKGADTMKMISNTSITSTIGVTLISLITALRRCRRRPTAPVAAVPPIPIFASLSSRALVDLPRQDGGELVCETLQALRLFVHFGTEFVIENRRRYGGHKPDRRGEKGFRNTRRNDRKRRIFRRRNRLKTRHDAPHGAKQADKRPGGPDRGEHEEPAFQTFDFPHDGDVHHLLDAHLQARERTRRPLEAAFPLPHGGHEQRRHGVIRPRRHHAIEFFQRLTRPEGLLESVHCLAGARIKDDLVDRNRPYPYGTGHETDHHRLDDPVGLQEQGENGEIRRGRIGWNHDSSFRLGGQCEPGRRRGKDSLKGAKEGLIGPSTFEVSREIPLPTFPPLAGEGREGARIPRENVQSLSASAG